MKPPKFNRKKDRAIPKDKQLSGAQAKSGRVPLQLDRKTVIWVLPDDKRLKKCQ